MPSHIDIVETIGQRLLADKVAKARIDIIIGLSLVGMGPLP